MEKTMTTPAAAASMETGKPVVYVEKRDSKYAWNLYHKGDLLLTSGYKFPNMGVASSEAGTLIHIVANTLFALKGERHIYGYRLSLRNVSHQEIASNGDWPYLEHLDYHESLVRRAFHLIRTIGVTIDINP